MEVTIATPDDLSLAQEVLTRFAVGDLVVEERTRKVTGPISGGTPVLTEALGALYEAGIELQDVGLRRPTLNDAF